MKFAKKIYEKIRKKPAPYYYDYSFFELLFKPLRKWLCVTIAPKSPFNWFRVLVYRMCGFKIGKKVFIGMNCYLDDVCRKSIFIGNNVTISYGVYFACHGKNQQHMPIYIDDHVYIGMRSNLISNNKDKTKKGIKIGKNAIIGACTLVNCDVPENCKAVGIPCKIIDLNKTN